MILIVCGPPGAGKTTIATRLRDRLAGRGIAFELLHSDDFRRRTYDRIYERVANRDADWILDGTFYRREHRDRLRELGDVRIAYVTAALETCLARNRARDAPIDERGVRVIHATFDAPDADVTVDTETTGPDEAVDRLVEAVEGWLAANLD